MLTTATPIFEDVPATFGNPLGLADQQASGVVALIVVRYEQTEDALAALGSVYDAFVCVSGQLLTVARSTPDYRFPVMPAVALRRFIEHRDAGRPAFLSVYELSETECARFIETVFYSECMKLMVGSPPMGGIASGDGAVAVTDAKLVADQLVRSGCGNGVLELNDFTDPARPRIRLVDLNELASSIGVVTDHSHPVIPGGTVDPAGLAAVLTGHLAGFTGRVLLYDRAKNKAALPDKTGTPFDLMAAIREANRLAQARRGSDATVTLAQAESELRASAPPATEQAEQVETYLKERAERPRAVEPTHPVASGLAALVLELQSGGPPSVLGTPSVSPAQPAPPSAAPIDTLPCHRESLSRPSGKQRDSLPRTSGVAISQPAVHDDPPGTAYPNDDEFTPIVWADIDIPGLPPPEGRDAAPSHPEPATEVPFEWIGEEDEVAPTAALAAVAAIDTGLDDQQPGQRFDAPLEASEPHPLAHELEALRTSVYDLLADSSSPEKAQASHVHALSELGIDGTHVPAHHVIAYVRLLLVEPPPKRWALFKRQRGRISPDVCSKLLAFVSAHSHSDDASIEEASRLWARLHK